MVINVSELQRAVEEASKRVSLRSPTRISLVEAITTAFIEHRTDLDDEALIDTVFQSEDFIAQLDEAGIDDVDYHLFESTIEVYFDRDLERKRLNPDKVVDGEMCILGRVASHVAEQALSGTKIAITNAKGLVITGNRENILDDYREKTGLGSDSGPRYPKSPDRLVKRTIRGMLPVKKSRGQEAYERIRVYISSPPDYNGESFVLEDAKVTLNPRKNKDFVRIGEISEHLGANPRWK